MPFGFLQTLKCVFIMFTFALLLLLIAQGIRKSDFSINGVPVSLGQYYPGALANGDGAADRQRNQRRVRRTTADVGTRRTRRTTPMANNSSADLNSDLESARLLTPRSEPCDNLVCNVNIAARRHLPPCNYRSLMQSPAITIMLPPPPAYADVMLKPPPPANLPSYEQVMMQHHQRQPVPTRLLQPVTTMTAADRRLSRNSDRIGAQDDAALTRSYSM